MNYFSIKQQTRPSVDSWEGAGGHSQPSTVGSEQPRSTDSLGARAFQTGSWWCSPTKEHQRYLPSPLTNKHGHEKGHALWHIP